MPKLPPPSQQRLRRWAPAYAILVVSLAATGALYVELAKRLDGSEQLPALALVVGLLISFVLFGIAWAQARGRAGTENLASHLKQSEADLRESSQELESKFQEAARTHAALFESQCRLRLLNSVLACMATESDSEEIIHRTIGHIREFLPEFRACYSIIGDDGNLKVFSSSEPPGWPSWQGHSLDLTTAPEYLAAIRRREPVIIADAAEDVRLRPLARTLAALGVRAVLDLPLRHSPTQLGLLCLNSPEPFTWSPREIATLQDVVEHLSIALRHGEGLNKRKEAEAALASEKELLSVTLRSIGDGIITTDTQARVLLLNRVAEELTGWKLEDAKGRPIVAVFDMRDEKTRERIDNPVEKVLKTGEIFGRPGEAVLIARDETERIVGVSSAAMIDGNNAVLGAVLVFRDVTEQRKLEAEILEASKIESLGLLAGGVAHDFNNILTGILGNVSLARMFAPHTPDLQKRLALAETACLRARDLTQQLLTFAKGGHPVKKTVSLEALIDEVAALALGGSSARSEISHPLDLWPVEADPAQMRHVISNLILHAVESMPEGGVVTIRTENVELTLESPLPLPAGRYVKMVIDDQGIGIQPEHLDKIFDPYFGAKPRSSGLGLATAYLIIKKHDGLITPESELGVGTRLTVYLPASLHAGEAAKESVPEGAVASGRILVLDDDTLVLELASVVLSRLGYEVELTENGSETVRRYQEALQNGRPFAAVILDLTVPGAMGAKDAVRQLAAIDPNVRAIVSSGYATDPVVAEFREHGFCGAVIKPYRLEELAKVLRQVLRQEPGSHRHD